MGIPLPLKVHNNNDSKPKIYLCVARLYPQQNAKCHLHYGFVGMVYSPLTQGLLDFVDSQALKVCVISGGDILIITR